MTTSLSLLRGSITLSEALRDDNHILQQLSYPEQRQKLFEELFTCRRQIESIASLHLGTPRENCQMGNIEEWFHGSFNVCIPVHIKDSARRSKRVMIRIPLPYKIGEAQFPGNAEEKLRCEAATYIWIQAKCPTVPTPYLWGFGFPGGQSFTNLENVSLLSRLTWYFRRTMSWVFGRPIPCRYVGHRRNDCLRHGYLVIDYVEEGEMLSHSWKTSRHDQRRKANLFRDLSRVVLELSRLPLPRIGSFTIDNFGVLGLTNRPLTLQLQQLENMGVPTNIARDQTYLATDEYLLDLLACHDSRILHHPNSILHESDGKGQLSALTIMRSIMRHFASRDSNHGPFILTLTDLYHTNIFVDSEWHITKIIDLEWACVRPAEMLRPPHWLTDRDVDDINDKDLEEYCAELDEFMEIFEAEENRFAGAGISYTNLLRNVWKSGKFWYFAALDCPRGLYVIFDDHIQTMFAALDLKAFDEFNRSVWPYWGRNATEVIQAKLKERELYVAKIKDAFAT